MSQDRQQEKEVDYLIIGQGLAGSFVANYLLERGKSLRIVDTGLRNASSVATGIINPVSGKRLVYADEFKTLAPLALREYAAMEGSLFEQPIVRVLLTEEEEEAWQRREESLRQAGICSSPDVAVLRVLDTIVRAYKSAWFVHGGGRVDTNCVLQHFRTRFEALGIILSGTANTGELTQQIEKQAETISFDGYYFRRVVFCEGWHIRQNPLFRWLPFVFAKGQILRVHLELPPRRGDSPLPLMIIGGKHLSPAGGNRYHFGSSYIWDEIDEETSDITTHKLHEELSALLLAQVQVEEARAGVRSVVRDIKPVVGVHPEYNKVFVVNGLASKGALYAPSMATILVEYMEDGKDIPPAYNVQRFIA